MGVRIIRGQDQQGPTASIMAALAATPTSTAVGMIDAVLDFVIGGGITQLDNQPRLMLSALRPLNHNRG